MSGKGKTAFIGGTSYNVEAVKSMTLTAFVNAHKHITTHSLEDAYYQITGKKRPQKKDVK